MRSKGRRSALALLAAAPLLLFALPLVGLLNRVEWSGLAEDLTTPEARSALWLSLWCSLCATGLSVLVGSPLAWFLARVEVPGRSVLRALVLLPMVLPPVVGGVALLSAFSVRSPVGGWLHDVAGIQLTFSPAGAILAETFVAMPFFVITLEAALRSLDQRYEEVAASLGAARLSTVVRVVVPLVKPSLFAGAVLAWARALGEFGATVTFAGNVEGRTRTLPLAIYLFLDGDRDAALALSLVLLVVSVAILAGLRDRWWSPS